MCGSHEIFKLRDWDSGLAHTNRTESFTSYLRKESELGTNCLPECASNPFLFCSV